MKYKCISFIALLCIISSAVNAQYVTPGNGQKFDLASLASTSNGVITVADGIFTISANVTLSATDTLEIITNETVLFSQAVQINVEGVLHCNPPEQVIFRAADTTLNFKGFRFNESNGSLLNNASIEFAGGTKVMKSDIIISNCRFYKHNYALSSGALDIYQCDPLVVNCVFENNERSAIMTAANAMASPTILNCRFIANSTLNSNRPQINLGTGSANPIIVRRNYIEGAYSVVGGLSIALLTGGSATVVVDSNIITNNRYGINIYGVDLSYTITNNIITNNNLETNPANGGSGISFNGPNQGTVAGNTITGNLWGITLLNNAQPNLGQIDPTVINRGENWIFDNGNGGAIYNLYNNTPNLIYAENNYWGTEIQEEIEIGIFHQPDDITLGLVDYIPFYQLSTQNNIVSFSLFVGSADITGDIIDESNQIVVLIPPQNPITELVATFEISEKATIWVDDVQQVSGITANDYSESVVFNVIAENGEERLYTVIADIAPHIQGQDMSVLVSPNPANESVFIRSHINIQRVTLLTIDGKVIRENNSGAEWVDVADIENGLYLLRIETHEGTALKKIVVNH
ncbi:MAG: T9SS type A sorting domain-containing protein [Salinivirgaceae bacterium]|nr:T9SS type A sorting domain-containing protein [Salinivirgaceae bacterium]